MQSVNLHGLIMSNCISGILYQTIPNNALVYEFHNLTDDLVQI